MLAVTDAQAQKLWWLSQNGEWTLRSARTRAADSPDSVEPRLAPCSSTASGQASASITAEGSLDDPRDPGTQSREVPRLRHGRLRRPDELCEALERHAEIEFVGRSDYVREGGGPARGRPPPGRPARDALVALPVEELASIREYTRAPIVLLASGESSALLEEALDADVADVLLLPQLTENVVFAIRKAGHAGRRAHAKARGDGRVITVFSPKGGTGKTVTATNLAASFAKYAGKRTLLLDLDLQFGDAAIMLGIEPEKTIYDLVVAPGELDPEKLAGYTTRLVGPRRPPGADRPEDAELVTEAKLARCSRWRRSRTT